MTALIPDASWTPRARPLCGRLSGELFFRFSALPRIVFRSVVRHLEGMQYRTLDSPIGPLLVAGDQEGLRFLLFSKGRRAAAPESAWEPDCGLLKEPVRQLASYFAGKLRDFDVPVAPEGTTFQRAVWRVLQRIPY